MATCLPYINDQRFEEVRLYLDNDDAGESATRKLFGSALIPSKLADMRCYYKGYDDLNAWLIGQKAYPMFSSSPSKILKRRNQQPNR